MARILVTGATGFVGRHLVARLMQLEHDVVEVNQKSGDVACAVTWAAFPSSDVVVHLAAKSFVPDSWTDPAGFLKTNFQGTVRALDYCKNHNSKIIFVSTYLYGMPDVLPIPESAALRATSPYALSKKLAEEVCSFYALNYQVDAVVLRPFNIYGPGQNDKFLIPSIVRQVREAEMIEVNDLTPKRDYIFIDDFVEAIVKAMGTRKGFDVFNIGSGVSHSVHEVVNLIKSAAGTDIPLRSVGARRVNEIMDTVADTRKARELLQWSPRWSLSDGIEAVVKNRRE